MPNSHIFMGKKRDLDRISDVVTGGIKAFVIISAQLVSIVDLYLKLREKELCGHWPPIMNIIFRSFILSFSVVGRMVLPIIIITIASMVVWGLLNLVTAGLASIISGPVTATFVSLVGIRAAFAALGVRGTTDYESLALSAVQFGVFFMITKGALIMIIYAVSFFYTHWQIGAGIPWRDFADMGEAVQLAFTLNTVSVTVILMFVSYVSFSVVMAVPLAGAARTATPGRYGNGFFTGAGRSFIPLFCVFAVSYFLQFFFELIHFFLAIVPLVLSVVSIIVFQTLPVFDPEIIVPGLLASAGLLFLHAWVWAASALAFLESDKRQEQVQRAAQPEFTAADARALRQSRK